MFLEDEAGQTYRSIDGSFAVCFESPYVSSSATLPRISCPSTTFHLADLNVDVIDVSLAIDRLDVNKNSAKIFIKNILSRSRVDDFQIIFSRSLPSAFFSLTNTSSFISIYKFGDKERVKNFQFKYVCRHVWNNYSHQIYDSPEKLFLSLIMKVAQVVYLSFRDV